MQEAGYPLLARGEKVEEDVSPFPAKNDVTAELLVGSKAWDATAGAGKCAIRKNPTGVTLIDLTD